MQIDFQMVRNFWGVENRSVWHFLGGGPGSVGVNVVTRPQFFVGRSQREQAAGALLKHDMIEHVGSIWAETEGE